MKLVRNALRLVAAHVAMIVLAPHLAHACHVAYLQCDQIGYTGAASYDVPLHCRMGVARPANDTGCTYLSVGFHSRGPLGLYAEAGLPENWVRFTRPLVINDAPGRLAYLEGEVPLGGTSTLLVRIRVRGTCGASTVVNTSISQIGGGFGNPIDYTISLPACPTPIPPPTSTPIPPPTFTSTATSTATPTFTASATATAAATKTDTPTFTPTRTPTPANTATSTPTSTASPTPTQLPACADNIDNDGDGLTDLTDPGCSGAGDTNEGDKTSQCQDGNDNDNDGLIDLNDPGCSSKTDNDESNATSQCQDGTDNDNDGLTDLNDPGCSSRTDNNESDEAAKLSLSAECVFANSDGSKTAYFSYSNSGSSELAVPLGVSGPTINEFVPPGTATQQLTVFKGGSVLGAVGVKFSGASVVWRVRPPGGALVTATANASTPSCKPITPQANCKGFVSDSSLRVKFGYSNPNSFDITIPIGPSNQFAPGSQDRGQPSTFFKGLVNASVDVKLSSPSEQVSWTINGQAASISGLPACSGECFEVPVGTIKTQINQVAIDLANLTRTAANALQSVSASAAQAAQAAAKGRDVAAKKAALKATKAAENDFIDAERAIQRADAQVALAASLLIEIPEIATSCPLAPKTCKTVDRQQTIDALRGLYAEAVASIKRINARTNFRKTGKTERNDPIVVKAKGLETNGLAELQKIPRFVEACSK